MALRKRLAAHTKSLAKMVDRDWHDGYEEQGCAVVEMLESYKSPLEAVLLVAGSPQAGREAFARCNDVLRELADAWLEVLSIPKRNGALALGRGREQQAPQQVVPGPPVSF